MGSEFSERGCGRHFGFSFRAGWVRRRRFDPRTIVSVSIGKSGTTAPWKDDHTPAEVSSGEHGDSVSRNDSGVGEPLSRSRNRSGLELQVWGQPTKGRDKYLGSAGRGKENREIFWFGTGEEDTNRQRTTDAKGLMKLQSYDINYIESKRQISDRQIKSIE